MSGLAWLTARPVAHRGLHDAAAGVIENTRSAVAAAVAAGFGIEVDLQVTADDDAVVHHDEVLGRLTEGSGRLAAMTAAQLQRVRFKTTTDAMMTLADLLDLVAGRATLVIELKSHFDGDLRLVRRAAELLARYDGPVAAMSFDPVQVAALRQMAPRLTRGVVASRRYDDEEWAGLSTGQKRAMAHLLHWPSTRPQFVAYHVRDLPAPGPSVARALFGVPLLTWTVRSPEDRSRATQHADQMIFEGFRP